MSSKAFAPYAPLNVLKPVAPEVWVVDGPEIRFGYLGLKLPFPTRMTVVRLPDGGLWLHSPTEPDEDLAAALAALGPVRCLIAPNTIHYWWIRAWKAHFPEARVFAVPGLPARAKRPLSVDVTLGEAPPPAWAGTIDQVLVAGDVLTEADFFHRPSRTLILTDLIENFEPGRFRRPWIRWACQAAGCCHPDGKAPIDLRATFLRHRDSVRRGARAMLEWQPERVILAHGRWYPDNAAAELKRAFRWAL